MAQLIDEMIERDTLGFAIGTRHAVVIKPDEVFGVILGSRKPAPTVVCHPSGGRRCAVLHDAFYHQSFKFGLGPISGNQESRRDRA